MNAERIHNVGSMHGDGVGAEIKLGALYATGNCVAPDRVAAYRHFSRAIQAQPNNVWLEQSRSRLWSDMSAAERQQAMEVEK